MAIYDTGTVTFSGTTVNGSGVDWQTANNPVRPGNTLLVMPANEAFTVVRINSATQLVVNRAPTKAISNSAYCLLLTDALSNDALAQRVSEMTRYYEQQVNAWGQLITASEDVSIVGPDGSAVKVPSLKKLYDGLNGKVDKNVTQAQEIKSPLSLVGSLIMREKANLDVGGFARFRKSTTFDETIQGTKGLNIESPPNESIASLSVMRTTTATSGTVDGGPIFCKLKSEGTEKIYMMGVRQEIGVTDYGFLSYRDFRGSWHEVRLQSWGDMNNLTGNWITGSDIRIKTDIQAIEDPVSLIRGLKLYSFKRDGRPMIGGIAQEIEEKIPQVVAEGGTLHLQNGETIPRVKSVDYSTLGYVALAALNQAVDKIAKLELRVKEIESRLAGKD